MKIYLQLLFFIFFFDIPFTLQKSSIKQFCQYNSDCTSGCCYKQSCRDYNTCSIMQQVEEFENKNFCKLDLDCNANDMQSVQYCCFDQKCVKADICIKHYYLPLAMALIFSVILGIGATFLINRCLQKQALKIKQELRLKQRRDNIQRQKDEMKKLLGEEGFQKYMEQNPEAFNQIQEPQKNQVDPVNEFLNKPIENISQEQRAQLQQQQQAQHYNFIRNHLMNNPEFQKMDQQQQHQMTLMVMQQQIQQQQQMAQKQQQQKQQFQQMQSNVDQQKNKAPNPIISTSQQLQPKKSQQLIAQSQQQQQQIRISQQSQNQPKSPSQLQSQILSPSSLAVSNDLTKSGNNGPKFFGKENPHQAIIQAQNPLYPDYKPNVPNPGKIEENLIINSTADPQFTQKRNILASNRRPLTKHITSQMMKEGPLPQ